VSSEQLVAETVLRNRAVDRAARSERPKLLGFIRRRVASDDDAEDILQDVFYQLAAGYDVSEPIEQISAWLYRVARNRIIDWYRKKSHAALPLDRQRRGDEGSAEAERDESALLIEPSPGPDDQLASLEFFSALEEALDELPEAQRNVFVWNELEGLTFREIAEQTGESINTLLSRKRYAVLFLRERLADFYKDSDTQQT
jgi:RNA polymerase sigma factor (sigma-70 family)